MPRRKPKRPAKGSSVQEAAQGINGNDYSFFENNPTESALSWNLQFDPLLQAELKPYDANDPKTYIPLFLSDDKALDGNNTLIFTLEPEVLFGFTQSVYRFKETDGDIQINISPKPTGGQIDNTFSEAVIIIEDVGVTDNNGVVTVPNIIPGTAQSETITGTDGVDILYGGSLLTSDFKNSITDRGTGNDTLEGLAGDDHLYGWDGDDRLDGGAGKDYLLGGAGSDRFELRNPPAPTDANPITSQNLPRDVDIDLLTDNINIDIIADFNTAEDTVGIYVGTANGTTIFSEAGLTPNQAIAPEQLHIGQEATTPTHRFIYNPVSGLLSFDADGWNIVAAKQVALLSPELSLSNTNIVTFNDPIIEPPEPPDPPHIPGAINGTKNNDLLTGSARADILNGKLGNDTLRGENGKDILIGGGGSDRLIGGKGRDTFVLETGAGVDRIIDFKDKQDRLGLPSDVQFQDLAIIQKGQNTLIRLGSDRLAFLEKTQRSLISAADFVPSPIPVI